MKQKIKLFNLVKNKINNWDDLVLQYLGFKKSKDVVYRLKNDLSVIARTDKFDMINLIEVLVLNVYTCLPDFQIQPDDVIVDIGANIGCFSLLASNRAKFGKVYSYEPGTENFLYLKRNLKLNNIANCFAYQNCISSTSGKKKLFLEPGGNNSLYQNKKNDFSIEVEGMTLQDIIFQNNIEKIDFLKMDIEGGEYEVLFNTPVEILKKIKRIALEYHHNIEKYRKNDLIKFFNSCGFEVFEPISKPFSDDIWRMIYAKQK